MDDILLRLFQMSLELIVPVIEAIDLLHQDDDLQLLLPVLRNQLIVTFVTNPIPFHCMLGLLDVPLQAFDVASTLVHLIQVILDLALSLLEQLMVLLTLQVQLLHVLGVLGNGFSQVLHLVLQMKCVLICVSGVLKVNDVVLCLDQLLLVLLVGFGEDEDGLAEFGDLGIVVLPSASAVVKLSQLCDLDLELVDLIPVHLDSLLRVAAGEVGLLDESDLIDEGRFLLL